MEPAAVLPLKAWESFYVIVGSSAAALTGLMFVVITLMADPGRRRTGGALDAFATPTIVHFTMALFIAAIVSAPWWSMLSVGVAIGAIGLGAFVYQCIVLRRAARQTDYKPVAEDWLWHVVLPIAAYLVLLVAGLELWRHPDGALFGVAAATLLLVFIGIHNAWDTVTYIALAMPAAPDDGS